MRTIQGHKGSCAANWMDWTDPFRLSLCYCRWIARFSCGPRTE